MYRKYYKPRQKKFYNREGEHLCIVCCVDLKPVPFLKINVEKKTNAYTLKTVFPDLEKNTGYMCPDCFAKIRKVTKASSKRRYILKKPVMPKKPAATKTAPIEIKGKLECDSSNYPYYKSKAKVKPRPAMVRQTLSIFWFFTMTHNFKYVNITTGRPGPKEAVCMYLGQPKLSPDKQISSLGIRQPDLTLTARGSTFVDRI